MTLQYKHILGLAALAVLILYSIHGVQYQEIRIILSDIKYSFLLLVLLLTTVNLLVRAVVFKIIMSPIKKIAFQQCLFSYLVGVFSNLFLPFKLGDIAQGYYLGVNVDISKVTAVSAVIIQRIFEIVSLLMIMVVLTFLFSIPELFQKKSLLIGIIIVVCIGILYVAFYYREKIYFISGKIMKRWSPRFAENVKMYIELFFKGTKAIHNKKDVFLILIMSFLSWFIQILMIKFTAQAMNISIDMLASSVVLLIINIGIMIPLAPGNIGTYQFFGIFALALFSVTKSKALLFSIIFQVIQGIPVILGGGSILARELLRRKTEKTDNL
jgi:uncharacterized protein (TIRG00374 family)